MPDANRGQVMTALSMLRYLLLLICSVKSIELPDASPECQSYFQSLQDDLSTECIGLKLQTSKFTTISDTLPWVIDYLPKICSGTCQNKVNSTIEQAQIHQCFLKQVVKSPPVYGQDLVYSIRLAQKYLCVMDQNKYCFPKQVNDLPKSLDVDARYFPIELAKAFLKDKPLFCTECLKNQAAVVSDVRVSPTLERPVAIFTNAVISGCGEIFGWKLR